MERVIPTCCKHYLGSQGRGRVQNKQTEAFSQLQNFITSQKEQDWQLSVEEVRDVKWFIYRAGALNPDGLSSSLTLSFPSRVALGKLVNPVKQVSMNLSVKK